MGTPRIHQFQQNTNRSMNRARKSGFVLLIMLIRIMFKF